MDYLLRSIFLVFLFQLSTAPIAQSFEICDNAIDDDGDGLIDLNDTDCACPLAKVVSLIPNPSFEDQVCCPPDKSRMDCAATWIQASIPTTDYMHTCSWTGWVQFPTPMPFPDGEGVIGFRDGHFAPDGTTQPPIPNWKEYAGACLTSPLKAGISYKFQFQMGFTQQPFSPPVAITFFGTPDCANLPFGGNDKAFGCPTNDPNWMKLSAINAEGTNEWKQYEINLTPTVDIHAIAIGPPCIALNRTEDTYYFFDDLILAEQSAFDFQIKTNNQPCALNLSFEVPELDNLTYQWYKDGIAIIGATEPRLDLPPGRGKYVLAFDDGEGCKTTKPYNFFIPIRRTTILQTICEGETYLLGNQQLSEPGTYLDTLKSVGHCDSIVELELSVGTRVAIEISAKIFPNESFKIGNFSFNEPGNYTQVIDATTGCDTTVNLQLAFYSVYFPNIFSPNGDGINDFFIANGGTDLIAINNFRIFDRLGNQVFLQSTLLPNNLADGWNGQFNGTNVAEGVYLYLVDLVMDDGVERTVSGMVTLVR